jgi:hypothetical protein
MPVSPVPTPAATDASGLGDQPWITDVRDATRDYPQYTMYSWTADGTNGVVGPGANPLKVPPPIFADGSNAGTINVFDSTGSVTYTPIYTGTPTGTQVLVNQNAGELTFASAPANNHVVQVSYQTVKWTDTSIIRVLYDGMRAMFPAVGRLYVDTSIAIQVNVWDYTLPVWAQSPGAKITRLEVADPFIITEPFVPWTGAMRRIGYNMIHLPQSQRYSPVARLRVEGWGPFLTLGDLPVELYELPILYALGRLMPKQDTYRLREDTMVPMTQEGGQAPGLLTSSGQAFMEEFYKQLGLLARSYGPPGAQIPITTTYAQRKYW